MLPITNQVQTRASPVPVQPTRVVETTAPISASAQLDIPPVEEADSAADTFQRGRDDIDRAHDAQSVAAMRQRMRQSRDSGADADSPQDRAVFRAKVIRFLQSIYRDDISFQRALQRGTIVIRAVEDMPEPDLRPEIAYAIYRQGAMQTGQTAIELSSPRRARGTQLGVGASDFVAWWPK
jgi:hypothetical protein